MRVAKHRIWHPGFPCGPHNNHGIDCGAFLRLLDRADGACEICREPWALDVRARRPFIDHDHASPIWAVRGLLCCGCNLELAKAERGRRAPDDAMRRYLEQAWYRTDALLTYQDRARLWLRPESRAADTAALWGDRTPPERYQRIQDARAAWCEAFLSGAPLRS